MASCTTDVKKYFPDTCYLFDKYLDELHGTAEVSLKRTEFTICCSTAHRSDTFPADGRCPTCDKDLKKVTEKFSYLPIRPQLQRLMRGSLRSARLWVYTCCSRLCIAVSSKTLEHYENRTLPTVQQRLKDQHGMFSRPLDLGRF